MFHVIAAATVQHTTAVHMMPDRIYANAQIYGVPYTESFTSELLCLIMCDEQCARSHCLLSG